MSTVDLQPDERMEFLSQASDTTIFELDCVGCYSTPLHAVPSPQQQVAEAEKPEPNEIRIDGEVYYFAESVIEYNPRKGFLFHWRGYPESARSWQRACDMPEGDPEIIVWMQQARDKYKGQMKRY